MDIKLFVFNGHGNSIPLNHKIKSDGILEEIPATFTLNPHQYIIMYKFMCPLSGASDIKDSNIIEYMPYPIIPPHINDPNVFSRIVDDFFFKNPILLEQLNLIRVLPKPPDATYVLRTIRKCGLYLRKTKMVATSQKCGTHF